MHYKSYLCLLFAAMLFGGCSDGSSSGNTNVDKPGPGQGTEDDDKDKDKDKDKPDPNPDQPADGKDDYPDEDGDTISDEDEGRGETVAESVDTDGDTTPDYLDEDSDDDTIPDKIEALNGGDPSVKPAVGASGEFAFRSKDSDGNEIPDADEIGLKDGVPSDIDADGVPDFISDDNDGDGALDMEEIRGLESAISGMAGFDSDGDGNPDEFGTPQNPIDFDGDGVPDFNDPDSDGDTVEDRYEAFEDANRDGILDRYSKDSDGDTVPDRDERGTGEAPADTDKDGLYDFRDLDSDDDGLPDEAELKCPDGRESRVHKDTDGDGESDLAEYAIATRFGNEPVDYICDANVGVKQHISFFFDLPRGGEEKTDTLTFNPKITKADVFINIDNSGLMGSAITMLQQEFIKVVVAAVRERVPDSAFGASIFRDTDAPPAWELRSAVTTDTDAFQNVLNEIKTKAAGTDEPQAGYNALYEIAAGGAGFRDEALPIILHITSAPSNENGRTQKQAFDAVNAIGARVIPMAMAMMTDPWPARLKANAVEIAKGTNSVVPVCAYQNSDKTWVCGENKCCTSERLDRDVDVPDSNNMCPLAIKTPSRLDMEYQGKNLPLYETVLAIEALVKYSTYNVSTRVKGEPLDADEIADPANSTTSCFIKRVEAVSYVPPQDSTISECLKNIKTAPKDFANVGYNDGFEHFAVGAAMPDSPKSQLLFNVIARNDNCVKKSSKVRSYKVMIEVIDPVTKMKFDGHEVMVIVPGEPEDVIN